VLRNDPQTGISNVWVLDIATGKATPVTNETQSINTAVWSRDGSRLPTFSSRTAIPASIERMPTEPAMLNSSFDIRRELLSAFPTGHPMESF
jgi:Tol biopolymer transport system component